MTGKWTSVSITVETAKHLTQLLPLYPGLNKGQLLSLLIDQALRGEP